MSDPEKSVKVVKGGKKSPLVLMSPSAADAVDPEAVVPDVGEKAVDASTADAVVGVAVVAAVVGDSCPHNPSLAMVPEKSVDVAVIVPKVPEKVPEPADVAVVAPVVSASAGTSVVPEKSVDVAVVAPVASASAGTSVVPADVAVPPVDPAAGVGNSVVLAEVSSALSDIATDPSVSDQLLKVILDATLKKPESGKEAVALAAYVYKKDIEPLIKKLQDWAVEELKKEDASVVRKAWNEAMAIEKQVSGWCCVPKKAAAAPPKKA